jgi:hypothetical protein
MPGTKIEQGGFRQEWASFGPIYLPVVFLESIALQTKEIRAFSVF